MVSSIEIYFAILCCGQTYGTHGFFPFELRQMSLKEIKKLKRNPHVTLASLGPRLNGREKDIRVLGLNESQRKHYSMRKMRFIKRHSIENLLLISLLRTWRSHVYYWKDDDPYQKMFCPGHTCNRLAVSVSWTRLRWVIASCHNSGDIFPLSVFFFLHFRQICAVLWLTIIMRSISCVAAGTPLLSKHSWWSSKLATCNMCGCVRNHRLVLVKLKMRDKSKNLFDRCTMQCISSLSDRRMSGNLKPQGSYLDTQNISACICTCMEKSAQ